MRNKSQSSLILSKSRSPSLFFSDFQLFSYCFVQFPHSKKLFFSVSLTQFLIFSYTVSLRRRATEALLSTGFLFSLYPVSRFLFVFSLSSLSPLATDSGLKVLSRFLLWCSEILFSALESQGSSTPDLVSPKQVPLSRRRALVFSRLL